MDIFETQVASGSETPNGTPPETRIVARVGSHTSAGTARMTALHLDQIWKLRDLGNRPKVLRTRRSVNDNAMFDP
jgi:hypothetical protein